MSTKGIYPRKNKKGIITSHQVKIRQKGRAFSGSFDTLAEAATHRDEALYAIERNLPFPWEVEGPTEKKRIACEDALKKYIEEISPTRTGKTAVKNDERSAKPLVAYFGAMYLHDITPEEIESYMEKRLEGKYPFEKKDNSSRKGKGVGNSAVRQEIALLSNVFKTARTQWSHAGLLNPTREVKRPPEPQGREKILTESEAAALFVAAKKSPNKMFYPYLLIMLQCAMRPSEAAGLQWTEVGWEQRTLFIDPERVKTRWKIKKERRVPLTTTALNILKALYKKADPEKNPNVFLPIDRNVYLMERPSAYFRCHFEKARKAAGLRGTGTVTYTMRHTAGTHLVAQGERLAKISQAMGHTKATTTMKYVHLDTTTLVSTISANETLGVVEDESE